MTKHPGGRPTSCTPEVVAKAREYLDNLPGDQIIHTIEGLALYIHIDRSTIYDWIGQDDKQEFADIAREILAKQGLKLVNKGLDNTFNSKIAAVMLSKHGYAERTEHTGKDGADLFRPSQEEKDAASKALESLG